MTRRVFYLLSLLAICWLGMMLIHECGHMLAAVCTGGRVVRLEWPVIGFSRTEVSPNPHPLVVAWGGPVLGGVVPLGVALVWRVVRRRCITVEIFSSFCLLANGVYLTAGGFGRIGDAGDLLKFGSALWILWAVGVPLVAAGVAQSHLLGSRLGTQQVERAESRVTIIVALVLLATSAALQLVSG